MADLANQRIGQGPFGIPGGSPTFSNFACSSTTHGVGFVLQALSADPITQIGYRYGARTGTPPTYVATLESPVTSTGLPDGVDLGGGSPTAKTFTPPADTTIDGLWQWVALTNSYTPTRGQFLCPTIRYSSGTVDGSNNSSFTTDATNLLAIPSIPYPLRLTSGTWAKRAVVPIMGLRTASTRYGNIVESIFSTRSASTVGHRRALKFTVPSGTGTSFIVKGLRCSASLASAAGKNPIMGLWSAGGVIQNVTLDTDVVNSFGTFTIVEAYFDESSLTALSPGTAYYAGFEVADGTTGGLLIHGAALNNASDLLAHPGGTTWHLATYDGSSWTDDQLTRPFAELILDDWTASAGSGGLLIGGNLVQ